jgi:DNA-binding transcriptional regulator YhcF (GntR family)
MAERIGAPAYQQVADDLRSKISEGVLKVGEAIPSAAKLQESYKVSSTVVQRAINELRGEGLLIGQPGKGVFVKAVPKSEADVIGDLGDLADRFAVILRSHGYSGVTREQVEELLRNSPESENPEEVEALRRWIAEIEASLIELYGRVGQPYPHRQEATGAQQRGAPSRRRKPAMQGLAQRIADVEERLKELYSRLGQPYPRENKAAGHGRTQQPHAKGA